MNKKSFILLIILVAILPFVLILVEMQQNIQKKAAGYEYVIRSNSDENSFTRLLRMVNPIKVSDSKIFDIGDTIPPIPTESLPTGVITPGAVTPPQNYVTITIEDNRWVGSTEPEPTVYDPDPRVREDF